MNSRRVDLIMNELMDTQWCDWLFTFLPEVWWRPFPTLSLSLHFSHWTASANYAHIPTREIWLCACKRYRSFLVCRSMLSSITEQLYNRFKITVLFHVLHCHIWPWIYTKFLYDFLYKINHLQIMFKYDKKTIKHHHFEWSDLCR